MKIANLKVGTRLGIGFAIVLFLTIVSTAIGIWNLRQVALSTQQMMETPLTKERKVSDWYAVINAAVIRTSFIIKSADLSLPTTFAEEIEAGAKKGGGMQNALELLLSSDEEKEMFGLQRRLLEEWVADQVEFYRQQRQHERDQRLLDKSRYFEH